MLAFVGTTLPAATAERLRSAPSAGITLFRYHNVETPGQLRELTDAAQRAAAAGGWDGPLLVAADQEGGQLLALGDGSTPFPGNMALGATSDVSLAERVGAAIGAEALAMGVNVVYAPSADLASNPANPHLGIRAFGDDPATVSSFVAATVRGIRSSGAAATLKHFPGLGEADLDTHHGLPDLGHDRARLDAVELAPFAAGIDAGAEVVMSAHVALSALTGSADLPATLSRSVMTDLVRGALGFRGLSITDALDMEALPQGDAQALDAVAAIRAGVDLLLCTPDEQKAARIEGAVMHAAARRLFEPDELRASASRLAALRARLSSVPRPDLAVVGSATHQALAREVADRSITLVRDRDGLLPLRLATGDRIVAVMPRPRNLTPADTSASVSPGLAVALREHWPDVHEIVTAHPPTDEDARTVREAARDAAVIVLGTITASADRAQADLVDAVLDAGRPVVTVSLRTPWDLAAYPRAGTNVAAYGILPPTLAALAATLFGQQPFRGRLPVALPAGLQEDALAR
ncbi:MAG TPA: glycoside hydrolase family 3 N-terminal domain-containing protein [Candidatus Limnocylindrales bacterium]|nr:glycoside hydrolase family 3 N-terminal domain-containing protein [Candidatus Limnocylindrales bacterium]